MADAARNKDEEIQGTRAGDADASGESLAVPVHNCNSISDTAAWSWLGNGNCHARNKGRLILKSVKLLDNWRETQEAAGQTAQTAPKTRCKTVLPKVASSRAAS